MSDCGCDPDHHAENNEQAQEEAPGLEIPDTWPPGWDDPDTQNFLKMALMSVGYPANDEGMCRYMAHELASQGATTSDFMQYMTEQKGISHYMNEAQTALQKAMVPVRRLMDAVKPRPDEIWLWGLIRMLLLIMVMIPTAIPCWIVRLWYGWRVRYWLKRHDPHFRTWWAKRVV